MGLFNRKEKESTPNWKNNIEEDTNRVPPIGLSNGKYISFFSVEDFESIRHSDGRQTIIKIMGISNQYELGDAMSLEPSKYIAFEIPKGEKVSYQIAINVLSQYLREMDNNEICQYIGEYDMQQGNFSKTSQFVENRVRNEISQKIIQAMQTKKSIEQSRTK